MSLHQERGRQSRSVSGDQIEQHAADDDRGDDDDDNRGVRAGRHVMVDPPSLIGELLKRLVVKVGD